MATSTINHVHGFTEPLSESPMRSGNPDLFDSRLPRMYPVHQHIYIYSVARRDFQKRHPYFKGVLHGCTGKDAHERYVLCATIPDPPQQIAVDAERGGKRVEVEPRDEAGWRVAIDILNPNNPTLDPYVKMGPKASAYFSTSQNVDLVKWGLFPSLHNPPTEEELKRAEKARDDSDQALIDEAFAEQASNPAGFRLWLRNHPEVNATMDALGIEADWHKTPEIHMTCPNCGDRVKQGIAFHKSSAGVLCVIDPERAEKAGVRTFARKKETAE